MIEYFKKIENIRIDPLLIAMENRYRYIFVMASELICKKIIRRILNLTSFE